MVRAAGLVAALLLVGCDGGSFRKRTAPLTSEMSVMILKDEIDRLRSRVDELERAKEANHRLLTATGDSLEEARDNHKALLKTFNSNVVSANEKANGTLAVLRAVDERLSRYDGQRSTPRQ